MLIFNFQFHVCLKIVMTQHHHHDTKSQASDRVLVAILVRNVSLKNHPRRFYVPRTPVGTWLVRYSLAI